MMKEREGGRKERERAGLGREPKYESYSSVF